MPFEPTTPTSGNIPQPDVSHDCDTFFFLSVKFTLVPGAPASTKMDAEWVEGYMDGADFVPVKTFRGHWDGDTDSDLVDALNTNTSGGTMYNEVKASLWDFLQTKGKIGAGTVT